MKHLALLDQILDRACYILDRHSQIHTVLVIEINAVCFRALERTFDHPSDMLRSTVQAIRSVDLETELGGDCDLITHRSQCLGYELLVHVGSVHFGRVEETDATIVSIANYPQARRTVYARTVVTGAVAVEATLLRPLSPQLS